MAIAPEPLPHLRFEITEAAHILRISARSKKPDGRWAWCVELKDAPVSLHRTSTIDGSDDAG
jgi:hypothetical protein